MDHLTTDVPTEDSDKSPPVGNVTVDVDLVRVCEELERIADEHRDRQHASSVSTRADRAFSEQVASLAGIIRREAQREGPSDLDEETAEHLAELVFSEVDGSMSATTSGPLDDE